MGIVRRGAVSGACLLLALTGCSNSSSGGGSGSTTGASPSAPANSPNHLIIQSFAFRPTTLPVAPGAVVTVTNADQTAHTVTANSSGAFDTGTIAPGRTVTFTAPKATGTYAYHCTIHPFMKGTLTVR
ncbi:cupredoxin domain-containing protein [Streptomyces sp. NPDC020917]|uniref:cupredoxin domain-containing protein n=1 Tax=Streptomyces sp. NPDC020917 TaxID=3365102 RepID=UPI0037AF2F1C